MLRSPRYTIQADKLHGILTRHSKVRLRREKRVDESVRDDPQVVEGVWRGAADGTIGWTRSTAICVSDRHFCYCAEAFRIALVSASTVRVLSGRVVAIHSPPCHPAHAQLSPFLAAIMDDMKSTVRRPRSRIRNLLNIGVCWCSAEGASW